jgi:Na+/citrate or Na+/malate symporter
MVHNPFERGTLLDLTVNVIPMVMLVFFIVLFLVVNPWRNEPFTMVISIALMVVPFFFLGLLTYVSGLAIQRGESALETDASPPR